MQLTVCGNYDWKWILRLTKKAGCVWQGAKSAPGNRAAVGPGLSWKSSSNFGSRPSDHYFRSVCLFVCLFVCLCRVLFSRLRSDLDQTRGEWVSSFLKRMKFITLAAVPYILPLVHTELRDATYKFFWCNTKVNTTCLLFLRLLQDRLLPSVTSSFSAAASTPSIGPAADHQPQCWPFRLHLALPLSLPSWCHWLLDDRTVTDHPLS